MAKEDKYIDREISLIDFNDRVLFCASNKKTPMNERFKYLGITSSNLDEFLSVRFTSAMTDGRDKKKVAEIRDRIIDHMKDQYAMYECLMQELYDTVGLRRGKLRELTTTEKEDLHKMYTEKVFPLLTPVNVGTVNQVPNLKNGQLCAGVLLKSGNTECFMIIPIDDRVIPFNIVQNKIIMAEDIIEEFLGDIFVNKEIVEVGFFRPIKDFNLQVKHDGANYLIDRMYDVVEEKVISKTCFLIMDEESSDRFKKILKTIFELKKEAVFDDTPLVDYKRFTRYELLPESCSYKKFEGAKFTLIENGDHVFSVLKDRDVILHHPYDSYDTVVKFVEEAANDPDVMVIKQTLYRVSSENSPIVNALCKAAQSGKTVNVLLEIKARADEQQNIKLVQKLTKSGVNVMVGIEYLKTHCKFCVVIKDEGDTIGLYSHIGTGNYNESTSKIYTDISFLTAKKKIGLDLINIFNMISGMSEPENKLQRIFYAPVNLRSRIIKSIDKEIENAQNGKKAEIFMKLNALNDVEICSKLYEAADAGVRVDLIIRGVCSIVPRPNLTIKSIVGRFLEHSRIYYFRNDKDPKYYIGSADLLTRNLDKRVEILLLVNEKENIKKLKNIMNAFKEDTANSFKMIANGKYKKSAGDFDCHAWFIRESEHKLRIKLATKKKGVT